MSPKASAANVLVALTLKIDSVRLALMASAFLVFALKSFADVQATVGYHPETEESTSFAFTNIPPPSRNNAAVEARFAMVSGEVDINSGGLERLHDGKVPTEADEPGQNFFFAAGTDGGQIQVDLGQARELKQINTYSWHPASRGPQVYKLYASDGAAQNFIAKPGRTTDLKKCGWKQITNVDTRGKSGAAGGQYGVSIFDSAGNIGNFRYLLFDISPTEVDDAFGNTFYSEIDVVEANTSPEPISSASPAIIVQSVDGQCRITIDVSGAPKLKEWAELKLAPALAAWYPKIVAMMPNDGFVAPKAFHVVLRPGDGVASTRGMHINANSIWIANELSREAVGALIHELVHVVQQYGNVRQNGTRPPNWLVEGIPDYIRFFKFEPQSHGADIIWLQRHRNLVLNYDGSYRISANFLDFVVEHYDVKNNLIGKLNAACRQGAYTDELWKELAGKSLAELNEEWKTTIHKQLVAETAPLTNKETTKKP